MREALGSRDGVRASGRARPQETRETEDAGWRAEGVAEGTWLPPAVALLVRARTVDAVFAVAPDHRVVHWDSRMESLTGILAEEALGLPFYEALSGACEDGGSLDARAWSALRLAEDGRAVPGYEARIETRVGGGARWVGVSVLSVVCAEGTYLVHLVRDAQRARDTLEMARGLIRLSPGRGEAAPPFGESGRPDGPRPGLTPRQGEVLGMLAEGKGVKEIGRELYLSRATVRNHVRSLLQALGAHSQLEALARAREAGLLDHK